ncbi:MAG: hypothetical protein HFG26_13330 [Provencibacterium sp.]|jgi:hypothetical protein|nr:hypothetical protein [Provencibacterium sp.]
MAEWKGVHYSDHDMLHMQQEAIRRVRQMQQRARQSLDGPSPADAVRTEAAYQPVPPAQRAPYPSAGTGSPIRHTQALHSAGGPPQHAPHAQPSLLSQIGNSLGLGALGGKGAPTANGEESRGLGSLLGSIVGENSPAAKALDALGIDNERLLLIGLLLVLMNEKADRTLIIALVYLLL